MVLVVFVLVVVVLVLVVFVLVLVLVVLVVLVLRVPEKKKWLHTQVFQPKVAARMRIFLNHFPHFFYITGV